MVGTRGPLTESRRQPTSRRGSVSSVASASTLHGSAYTAATRPKSARGAPRETKMDAEVLHEQLQYTKRQLNEERERSKAIQTEMLTEMQRLKHEVKELREIQSDLFGSACSNDGALSEAYRRLSKKDRGASAAKARVRELEAEVKESKAEVQELRSNLRVQHVQDLYSRLEASYQEAKGLRAEVEGLRVFKSQHEASFENEMVTQEKSVAMESDLKVTQEIAATLASERDAALGDVAAAQEKAAGLARERKQYKKRCEDLMLVRRQMAQAASMERRELEHVKGLLEECHSRLKAKAEEVKSLRLINSQLMRKTKDAVQESAMLYEQVGTIQPYPEPPRQPAHHAPPRQPPHHRPPPQEHYAPASYDPPPRGGAPFAPPSDPSPAMSQHSTPRGGPAEPSPRFPEAPQVSAREESFSVAAAVAAPAPAPTPTPPPPPPPPPPPEPEPEPEPEPPKPLHIFEALTTYIKDSSTTLTQVFSEMDKDKSGYLERKEVAALVKRVLPAASAADHKFFRGMIDVDDNAKVTLPELREVVQTCTAVVGDEGASRREARLLMAQMGEMCLKKEKDPLSEESELFCLFDCMDLNDSGFLEYGEVVKLFKRIHKGLTVPQLRCLVANLHLFDKNHDGKLSFKEMGAMFGLGGAAAAGSGAVAADAALSRSQSLASSAGAAAAGAGAGAEPQPQLQASAGAEEAQAEEEEEEEEEEDTDFLMGRNVLALLRGFLRSQKKASEELWAKMEAASGRRDGTAAVGQLGTVAAAALPGLAPRELDHLQAMADVTGAGHLTLPRLREAIAAGCVAVHQLRAEDQRASIAQHVAAMNDFFQGELHKCLPFYVEEGASGDVLSQVQVAKMLTEMVPEVPDQGRRVLLVLLNDLIQSEDFAHPQGFTPTDDMKVAVETLHAMWQDMAAGGTGAGGELEAEGSALAAEEEYSEGASSQRTSELLGDHDVAGVDLSDSEEDD